MIEFTMNHAAHPLRSYRYALGCAAVIGACIATVACGSRTQSEVGGKTSWLAACSRDADCSPLEDAKCVQNLCTVECENTGCAVVGGTQCASPLDGCFEAAACLPACSEPSDCRNVGSNYACVTGVCVLDSCEAGVTPEDDRSEGTLSAEPSSAAGSATQPGPQTNTNILTSPADTNTATTSAVVDGGVSGMASDCAAVMRTAPRNRPYASAFGEVPRAAIEGEPACEGACGYVSGLDANGDLWSYSPVLACPLDVSRCDQLQDALDASPARCNTLDDCLSYSGLLELCETVFDGPNYWDSALFSAEERAARQEIYREMQALGCRRPFEGNDGPMYDVGCVDGMCQLVVKGYCGLQAALECDACGPDSGL